MVLPVESIVNTEREIRDSFLFYKEQTMTGHYVVVLCIVYFTGFAWLLIARLCELTEVSAVIARPIMLHNMLSV